MGRKRAIDSPEKFSEIINSFIEHCIANKLYPSDYQLRVFSNIQYATLWNYCHGDNGDDRYKPYIEQYKKLVQFREDYLAQVAMDDPKKATFAIFCLKQPKNGGYQDRPAVDLTAKELKITVQGVGDKAFE